ncbi:TetR/AcrR family transcriptional regulator [Pseudarthrobacter sp. SSS035]|uniref:TetR/AcrR family transcriptional regulator n=1 Tax=Pseudarthrobacter sp. SSS035 TaxID=2931399 RepID=UPI00200BDE72|nr:TetR/AcrR family transcriptional regulator [Pseudarthrobacter sp. SSS035]
MHSQREAELESLQIAALPHVIRLAWGLGAATNRGPKPKYTTDRILGEAIRIADEDGLEGLSMASLAAPLGLAATALYRYVDSKETLIELMVDRAVGHPPSTEPSSEWSRDARNWAVALLDAYVRHPWLSDVVVTGMPRTPNSLEWIESLLNTLAGSPLSQSAQLSATLLLQGIVRNHAALMRSVSSGASAADSFMALLPALGARAYPRLTAELQREWNNVSDEFDFAVATVIRGLAAQG